ncbi:hypothetical protein HFN60_30245 [Rhizobium leguminosarum]|uniref:hypothetical protein n=1 Tax=Rhizobium leguminosarum TaxID=384 RepID=UPI001C959DB8|nr:hypothetical protein [Rhizobium leguminosarum]MBY5819875.1 hypothetical protein [Rhizobium leguminosarum]
MLRISTVIALGEREGRQVAFAAHLNRSRMNLLHHDKRPTAQDWEQAHEIVREQIGNVISIQRLQQIVYLDREALIALAMEGAEDIAVRDLVLCAISRFYLDCLWPSLGDGIDINRFIEILKARVSEFNAGCPDEGLASTIISLKAWKEKGKNS